MAAAAPTTTPAPAAPAAASAPASASAPAPAVKVVTKTKFYSVLHENARRYLKSTRDATANLSNIAALVYHDFRSAFGANSLNWCGFYIARRLRNTPAAVAANPSLQSANADYTHDRVLMLGPFHGLPAVTLIPYEKGVCGTCAVQRATQLVPDVHAHPNHIACDSASQSEIVVPLFRANKPAAAAAVAASAVAKASSGAGAGDAKGEFVAMLDMDSPVVNGFDADDAAGLEQLLRIVADATDLHTLDTDEAQGVDVNWNFAGVSCVAKKKH